MSKEKVPYSITFQTGCWPASCLFSRAPILLNHLLYSLHGLWKWPISKIELDISHFLPLMAALHSMMYSITSPLQLGMSTVPVIIDSPVFDWRCLQITSSVHLLPFSRWNFLPVSKLLFLSKLDATPSPSAFQVFFFFLQSPHQIRATCVQAFSPPSANLHGCVYNVIT